MWTRSRKLGSSCDSRTCDCNGGVPGLSLSLLEVQDCMVCCLDGGGLMRLLVGGGRFSLESGSGQRTEE